MDTFLGSLVHACCGEGGTLQTNNTGVCSQCLSHTGFASAHGVCGFVQVACQGFLVREACVGVLVGGAGFLLSGVQ